MVISKDRVRIYELFAKNGDRWFSVDDVVCELNTKKRTTARTLSVFSDAEVLDRMSAVRPELYRAAKNPTSKATAFSKMILQASKAMGLTR